MREPIWIGVLEALILHDMLLATFGGPAGVRDAGLLESTLARPRNLVVYGKKRPSLARLAARRWRRFLPGHGGMVEDPAARLTELITHRRAREAAILQALATGPASASEMAARLYTDTPPALLGAASRNILAHLIDLVEKGRVGTTGLPSLTAPFHAR